MLDQFTVQDFKSLVDVRVDLSAVNVFIGANGSGKSNLLEAVGILGAAASGRVNDESLKYRGVRPGVPALYKASFQHRRGAVHIRFEADGCGASYTVSLLNPIGSPTPNWAFKHERLLHGDRQLVGRGPHTYEQLNPNAGLAALKAVEMTADNPAGTLLDSVAQLRHLCPGYSHTTRSGTRPTVTGTCRACGRETAGRTVDHSF